MERTRIMTAYLTCQRAKKFDEECSNLSKGFVLNQGDSPSAVWKDSISLCKTCGTFIAESVPGALFVTTEELQELMAEESQVAGQVLPSTLQELQQKLTSANADTSAEHHAPHEAKPASDKPQDQVSPMASDQPGPSLAERIAALETEMGQLQGDADTLLAQIDMTDNALVKNVLREAHKKLVRQVQVKEKDIATLRGPIYVPIVRTAEEWALRHAIYMGGLDALRALDAALASGIIGKKASTKKAGPVPTSETQGMVVADAEHKVQTRKDNDDRNARVVALKAQGHTQKAIADLVGLTEGQVSGILFRATKKAA